jgi:2-C-methyl-D-erythritol 2,4-cyclodiphosphate synthase
VSESHRGGGPVIRAGIGYDIHRLERGRPLKLGGVDFPSDEGLEGHSDAIADAVLGAAALGDIGTHFPPGLDETRGIDSSHILRHAATLVSSAGFAVVNVDTILIAERPKIAPHVEAMRQAIAACLNVASDEISIKATTNESLGAIGRGEGIAALAIATLMSTEPAAQL